MKRQVLTVQQYKRANRVIFAILAACYLFFIGIEVSNIMKHGLSVMAIVRCAGYVLGAIITGVISKKAGTNKNGTVAMATIYLLLYAVLVFGNGAGTLVMAFPAIIGFMIFLNEPLVMAGSIATFLISIVKCVLLYLDGDTISLGFASVVILGSFVAIWCTRQAVRLLILFSEENQEEIKRAAAHREEVARIVAGSVEKLNEDFKEVVNKLSDINEAMNTAHASMDEIARSSESTVEAINHQADMTGQIQGRLETANATASDAKDVSERLRGIILDGKERADELKEQSVLVDENTVRISQTVEMLVQNVEKVSGIVESILNISSQTNLLALNASIEAARAGEAGRGFSVVADQIRNLAEETKVSTEQIIAIIDELTEVTGETQNALHRSVESIEMQRRKVEQVNASFNEVERGMAVLESGVDEMSTEVENVMSANKGIVESIATLSAASEEVLAGTQLSKEIIDGTFENMQVFARTVDGTFEELMVLKQTAAKE